MASESRTQAAHASSSSIDPALMAMAAEIIPLLQNRLASHELEVAETLRAVASGELDVVETITDEEADDVRALFAWIAEAGPLTVWNRLATALPALLQGANAKGARALGSGVLEGIPLPRVRGSGGFVRLALLLISYVFYEEFHVPQPETGVYNIAANAFQKLKWAYRHQLNQLEVAEKGSGLEAHFAAQRLSFPARSQPSERHAELAGQASVSCAGDLLAVDVLTPANTPHLFDAISDFYSTADLVSANLESTVDPHRPVGRTQEPGQPARMNTSVEMLQKFRRDAKINYFATATNHSLDWGESGVEATTRSLNDTGAFHSGTATSQAEQDDVVVVEMNGVRVALLSYTFDTNGHDLPAGTPYLVNVVRFNDADPAPDYSLIKRHVEAARAKGADHVIAYCHWGWEFEMYPHAVIVEAARQVVACGVDTILGNHAHVSQPAEGISRGDGQQDALVIYGFGNFVSYHPLSRNSQLTYAVKFDLQKEFDGARSRTYLTNLQVLPLYISNRRLDDGAYDCRILRFEDVLADPDAFGLTDAQKSHLPHLHDIVWRRILSPLAEVSGAGD